MSTSERISTVTLQSLFRLVVRFRRRPKDYEPWTFEGTGSISEAYSSWTNSGAFSTDNQLQYTFLGAAANTPAPREPETKQSYDGGKQGRNDDISSRMEAMKKARDAEFKGIARQ
jgi:hypothetical protein